MQKRITYIVLVTLALTLAAFTIPNSKDLVVPKKKIEKAIHKSLKLEQFDFTPNSTQFDCIERGIFFKINVFKEIHGYVYVGRIATCSLGYCSGKNYNSQNNLRLGDFDNYESMDFFVVLDKDFTVQHVQIYEYDASVGLEITGKGWLKQFIKLTSKKRLRYGNEIDAVSGATISAKAFTNEIQQVLTCISP